MTSITPVPRSPLTVDDLGGDPRRRNSERVARVLLTGAAATSVVISVAIVAVLVRDALGFVRSIELADLNDDIWNPRLGRFGVMSPVLGTFWVTLVAVLVAGPNGLGAAIYLSEYANPRFRRIVKPLVVRGCLDVGYRCCFRCAKRHFACNCLTEHISL